MADELADPIQHLRIAVIEDVKDLIRSRMDTFLKAAALSFESLVKMNGEEEEVPEEYTQQYLREAVDKMLNEIHEPGGYSTNGITVGIDSQGAYLNFNCTYEIDFEDQIRGLFYLWEKELNEEAEDSSGPLPESK